jgi:hypothetical protein
MIATHFDGNTNGVRPLFVDFEGGAKEESGRVLIEQVGAEVCFLPAYSPDLNPIEMMRSKVKSVLRKAQPRTRPDLLDAISSALASVTPLDASGWFTHCNYSFI